MNEYDFKMYIVEDAETGSPLITMEFAGLETMEEAEDLANQLFAIISGNEAEELH